MKTKRPHGFTLVELLVVMGIIAVLISMLLPALTKARIAARYVAWQSFSQELRCNPNLLAYYNLQNDQGTPTITNMATSGGADYRFIPDTVNGTIYNDWHAPTYMNSSYSTSLQTMWHTSGRWPSKPCLNFTADGTGVTPLGFVGFGPGQANLAHALSLNNQVTICMWLNDFAAAPNNGTLFSWGDTLSGNLININYSFNAIWWDVSHGGNGRYCSAGLPNGMNTNTSNWNFWVFTYNYASQTMWIFRNGVNVCPSGSGGLGSGAWTPLAASYFTSSPRPASTSGMQLAISGNTISPGYNYTGQLDEFAIFNSDLSDMGLGRKSPNGYPGDDVTNNSANLVQQWNLAGQP